MHFLVLLPHTIVPVVPVLYAVEVINQLLKNSFVIFVPYNTYALFLQFPHPEKEEADSIILLVAPLVVELSKSNWVITRVNIFEGGIGLLSYCPVYLVLVL